MRTIYSVLVSAERSVIRILELGPSVKRLKFRMVASFPVLDRSLVNTTSKKYILKMEYGYVIP